MSLRRFKRRRGIAMADFIAGSLIFSATLGVFVGFTHLKFDTLRQAEHLSQASAALEAEVDRLRELGAISSPGGTPDSQGFRELSTFDIEELYDGKGRVSARSLRVDGGTGYQLYEVRVEVSWLAAPNDRDRAVTSLALPLRAGGGR